MLLLKNSDDKRYDDLRDRLRESAMLGRYEYPTTVDDMYEFLTSHCLDHTKSINSSNSVATSIIATISEVTLSSKSDCNSHNQANRTTSQSTQVRCCLIPARPIPFFSQQEIPLKRPRMKTRRCSTHHFERRFHLLQHNRHLRHARVACLLQQGLSSQRVLIQAHRVDARYKSHH